MLEEKRLTQKRNNINLLIKLVLIFIIILFSITTGGEAKAASVSQTSTTANQVLMVKNDSGAAMSVSIQAVGRITSGATGRKLTFTNTIPAGVTRAYVHYYITGSPYWMYVGYYDTAGSTAGQNGTLAIISRYKSSSSNSTIDTGVTYSVNIPDTPSSYNTWFSPTGTARTISRTLNAGGYLYTAVDSSYRDFVFNGTIGNTSGVTVGTETGTYENGKITLSYTTHEHSYTTGYTSYSATQHYTQKCSCGLVQTLADHTWNTSHKCTLCSYQGSHSYGEWSIITEATCTANGSQKRTCGCGGSETETIAALGHSYTDTCTVCGTENMICSRCSDVQTHTCDNEGPEIYDYTVSTEATNTNSFTVSFKATDNITGVSSIEIRTWTGTGSYRKVYTPTLANDVYTANIYINEIVDASTNVAPNTNGDYYIETYAYDVAGNCTITEVKTVAYDTIAPVNLSITINNDAKYTNTRSVSLTLGATDTGSGMSQMAISNTETVGTWETYATTKTWTLTDKSGVKTVYVIFKDKAGNVTVVL